MRLTDPHRSWPPHRLLAMLKHDRAREKESWKNSLITADPADKINNIGPEDRDQYVAWLAHLNGHFGFHPETFFLAVHTLDRFLTSMKCHPKYLKCVTVTSLYIASKIQEEEEIIPSTGELVENSDCGCRVKDIHRMERIMLSKLEWNVYTPTPLTYLHIFHSLAFSNHETPKKNKHDPNPNPDPLHYLARHLDILTCELQQAIFHYRLAQFPSAAVALTQLSIEIENIMPDVRQWVPVISKLQSFAKIKTNDLMGCREVLLSVLPRSLRNHCPKNQIVVYPSNEDGEQVSKQKEQMNNQATVLPVGAVKRKANDVQSLALASDHVKKVHTLEEDTKSPLLQQDITSAEDPNYFNQEKVQQSSPHLASGGASTQGSRIQAVEEIGQLDEDQYLNTVKKKSSTLTDQSLYLGVKGQLQDSPSGSPGRNNSFVLDLLVDSGISEDFAWSPSLDDNEYDSDKTLTASEGEEDELDDIDRKKHHATRMRPLTYAEIVKCGILEAAAVAVAGS